MVDIILIIILVGMPILLSFYNRNSQAYISYLINGKGELPIPLTSMTRKKFIFKSGEADFPIEEFTLKKSQKFDFSLSFVFFCFFCIK